MATCFVMQPFDRGVFDRRYEDVFAPAIRKAGLEAYRVDQDPKVSIPIDDIENGIRDAQICLADITQDNPNVWFELGFAIAFGKQVVLVCSEDRSTRFPFDVQHRSIIKYQTGSKSDFEKLGNEITAKILALLSKAEKLSNVADMSKTTKFEGLEEHEVVALAALAENIEHPTDHASMYQIKRDMEASGYTRMATTLAYRSLLEKGFVEQGEYQGQQDESPYAGYTLTDTGWAWIKANTGKFVLRKPVPAKPRSKFDDMADDIPF